MILATTVYIHKMRFNEWLALQESEQIVTPNDGFQPVPVTQPQLPDAKKVMYTACVLQKYAQTTLVTEVRRWMFENIGSDIPKDWIIRAHHMTVKFQPRQSDIEAIASLLGKEVELQVTDFAKDDHGIAVVVKPKTNFPLGNAIPHVTVAHSRDVGPVYSNTLLADRKNWIPVTQENLDLLSEMCCVLRDNVSTIPQIVNPASPTL